MKNYYFSIILEKDEDGYFVSCPHLQGCYSQGDTYEEAVANIKDAIRLHIEERLAEQTEYASTSDSISFSTVAIAV